MAEDQKMRSVSTRVGNISYTVSGEGRPVVLLHATLHDSHDFDPIIFRLAEHYQTIAVDWPWHGNTKGSDIAATCAKPSAILFADVLEDFVAALDLPPAILIGNSVGGFAAARLAITNPNRVYALVLVNTGGFTSWNLFSRSFCYIMGFKAVARIVLPYIISQYMNAQTPNDMAISQKARTRAQSREGSTLAATLWRSFLDNGHDIRAQAIAIKKPTLIIWGTKDIFPVTTAYNAQNSIPGSNLKLFDAGHVVFSSKPEEFLNVLDQFLQSIR
ncbi:alpha/beta fold hydrolase [Aspergillus tanneri]|uniref:AB hydrolase-1 domain-containing protein n=1 Tax=Aspergillus tanneri TaxID=1220188 RepID=A0A5M9N1M6_9EURO|nr:uncharacterized protein ATNIH1004_003746 [Aspergillus tanneri]KAA8651053.1 hypothetical protein ATNIH1004_003746 [Aspergillus tanneri]